MLGVTKAPAVTTTPQKIPSSTPYTLPFSRQPTSAENETPRLVRPTTPVGTSTPKTPLSPAFCIAGLLISCFAAGTQVRKAWKEETG